jgi:cytosine/creatinine deaminase
MTSPDEIAECYRMVTDRAAAVLGVSDRYGIIEGRPANLLVIPALNSFDVVRRQVRPTHVISRGRVVAEAPASAMTLHWPDEEPSLIDGTRVKDLPDATWLRQ